MVTHTAIIIFYKGEALPPFDARKGTWWWLDTYDGKHFAWCSTSIERAQGKRNHKEREKKVLKAIFAHLIWHLQKENSAIEDP